MPEWPPPPLAPYAPAARPRPGRRQAPGTSRTLALHPTARSHLARLFDSGDRARQAGALHRRGELPPLLQLTIVDERRDALHQRGHLVIGKERRKRMETRGDLANEIRRQRRRGVARSSTRRGEPCAILVRSVRILHIRSLGIRARQRIRLDTNAHRGSLECHTAELDGVITRHAGHATWTGAARGERAPRQSRRPSP